MDNFNAKLVADEDTIERLTPDKYWHIRTSQIEGIYLVHKMVGKHFPGLKPESEDVVMAITVDGTMMYWLRKTKLPAEELSKTIGYSVEALNEAKLVKLKVKETPDLKKPTVYGWGTA